MEVLGRSASGRWQAQVRVGRGSVTLELRAKGPVAPCAAVNSLWKRRECAKGWELGSKSPAWPRLQRGCGLKPDGFFEPQESGPDRARELGALGAVVPRDCVPGLEGEGGGVGYTGQG